MKRFHFSVDFTYDAGDIETLLSDISTHLSDAARHIGSGRPVEDACRHFKVEEIKVDWAAEAKAKAADAKFDNGTTDLRDHALDEHGVDEPTLDPESPAGKARVEQIAREESEREAMRRARANEGKSDAEIMAEHSAMEEAANK